MLHNRLTMLSILAGVLACGLVADAGGRMVYRARGHAGNCATPLGVTAYDPVLGSNCSGLGGNCSGAGRYRMRYRAHWRGCAAPAVGFPAAPYGVSDYSAQYQPAPYETYSVPGCNSPMLQEYAPYQESVPTFGTFESAPVESMPGVPVPPGNSGAYLLDDSFSTSGLYMVPAMTAEPAPYYAPYPVQNVAIMPVPAADLSW